MQIGHHDASAILPEMLFQLPRLRRISAAMSAVRPNSQGSHAPLWRIRLVNRPSLGVATTVLILGSKGVAQTAAAGALLTATGAVGAVLFASWALLDRWRTRTRSQPGPAQTDPSGTNVGDDRPDERTPGEDQTTWIE